ncbi:uncharacterized protein [Argopecten irradians]|uniref:uncharacterized protein isoform X2 n=1 Tax=Argopecten irradians TaxID=31199 RepID=UPI00371E7546
MQYFRKISRSVLAIASKSLRKMESDLPLWPEERTDLKLRIAETAARRSGVITPLLKEELWTKIQHSRLERGLEELKVEIKTPVTIPLTSEEQNKVKHRREKNREAAVRCRQKRKSKQMELEQLLETETERNRSLKEQYQTLLDEKQWLMSELGLISTSPATEDSARPWIPTPIQEPTQTWTPAPHGETDQGRSQILTPPPHGETDQGRTQILTPPPHGETDQGRSQIWTPPPHGETDQGRSQILTPPPHGETDQGRSQIWTPPPHGETDQGRSQIWTPPPHGETDQGRSQIWTPPPRSAYVWTPAAAEDDTSHSWTPSPKEECSGVWTPPPLKEIDVVWTSPLDEEACPPPPESFMYWPSHDELQVVPGVAGEGCSNDPFW